MTAVQGLHILKSGRTLCGEPRTITDTTYDRARIDYWHQQLGRSVACNRCCELLRKEVAP
jgi:hypothetical protein